MDKQEQCKWAADPLQFFYGSNVVLVQCKRGLAFHHQFQNVEGVSTIWKNEGQTLDNT